MTASRDPPDLEEPFELPGGRPARLRAIRPEDAPSIMAAFERLSPEAIRMRFFSTMKRLPPALAERLTHPDRDREMALVVASPDPPGAAEIYAVARLGADADPTRAELAIVVRDDLTRQGIGTRLMRRIIADARKRGLKAVYGLVLAENTAMLQLCRHLGFHIGPEPGQAALLRATLDLSTAPE